MSLSPTSGGTITVTLAQQLTRKFRSKFPNEINASFIGTDNINLILGQKDCIGIRVYHGYDEEAGQLKLVMVGVDNEEKDITDGYIMDRMVICPNDCDFTSALML